MAVVVAVTPWPYAVANCQLPIASRHFAAALRSALSLASISLICSLILGISVSALVSSPHFEFRGPWSGASNGRYISPFIKTTISCGLGLFMATYWVRLYSCTIFSQMGTT